MGNAGYGNHTENTKQSADTKRSEPTKSADNKGTSSGTHPAGPHADPKLTNPDSTPGTGALSDNKQGGEADSSSG